MRGVFINDINGYFFQTSILGSEKSSIVIRNHLPIDNDHFNRLVFCSIKDTHI